LSARLLSAKLVFVMQNDMAPNALPTAGEDWEMFLKTLE
jgi:hypothetical protein